MSARETASVVLSIVGGLLAVAGFTQWQMSGMEKRLQDSIGTTQNSLARQTERLDTIIQDTRPTYAMVQATDQYVRQNMPAFNEITALMSDELSEVAIAFGLSTSDLASASSRMNQLALDLENMSDPEFFVALRGDTDTLLHVTSNISSQYDELTDMVVTFNGEVTQKFANLERRISALPWVNSSNGSIIVDSYAAPAAVDGSVSYNASVWGRIGALVPVGGSTTDYWTTHEFEEFTSMNAAVEFLQSSDGTLLNAQIYPTGDGNYGLQYRTTN